VPAYSLFGSGETASAIIFPDTERVEFTFGSGRDFTRNDVVVGLTSTQSGVPPKTFTALKSPQVFGSAETTGVKAPSMTQASSAANRVAINFIANLPDPELDRRCCTTAFLAP
jgi:hypothetical protein